MSSRHSDDDRQCWRSNILLKHILLKEHCLHPEDMVSAFRRFPLRWFLEQSAAGHLQLTGNSCQMGIAQFKSFKHLQTLKFKGKMLIELYIEQKIFLETINQLTNAKFQIVSLFGQKKTNSFTARRLHEHEEESTQEIAWRNVFYRLQVMASSVTGVH